MVRPSGSVHETTTRLLSIKDFFHAVNNIAYLRQDKVLHDRTKWNGVIFGPNPCNRGIQIVEQLFADLCGYFSTKAACQTGLMDNKDIIPRPKNCLN